MRYSERRFAVGTSLEAGQRHIASNSLGNRHKEWKSPFAKCALRPAPVSGLAFLLPLPFLLLTFEVVRNLKDIGRRANSL